MSNLPSLDVRQIDRAPPRHTECSTGKSSKSDPDRIDISGVIGGQPTETDQRFDSGGREIAHDAGPTLRIRTGRCTGQDRPLDEIGQRSSDRTLIDTIGFGEPAQRDEIRYDPRPDVEADDRLAATAARS